MGKLDKELRNELSNALKIGCKQENFDKIEQINLDVLKGKAHLKDLKSLEMFKDLDDKNLEAAASASKRVRSLRSVVEEVTKDAKGELTQEFLIEKMTGSKTYNWNSIADIRIIDLSTAYDYVDSTETPFLNTVGDAIGVSANDVEFKYYELSSNNALEACYFDPSGSPNVVDSQRTPRTNTMSFIGTGQQVTLIAEAINSNQGFTSQMEEALKRGYNDLRKCKDMGLLNNTESKVSPFRNGGLVSRTTTNVWNVGGNFTDLGIDTNLVKPIVDLYGPQNFMLAVPNRTQISVIDTFRSTRAPGRQVTDLEFGMMRAAMNGKQIPMGTVYNSMLNGFPIPVFYLRTLPTGTAMLYSPDNVKQRYLQLGTFGSGPGPYVLMSLQGNGFAKIMQMFETFSLENHGEKKCAKATNLT